MEDDSKYIQNGLDLKAEKITLSDYIKTNQNSGENPDPGPTPSTLVEPSVIRIPDTEFKTEPVQPEPIKNTESKFVDVVKNETNPYASMDMSHSAVNGKIKEQTDSLRSDINDSIIPMIENLSGAVSNALPSKDGDKLLERRINQSETNPVFMQRMESTMGRPLWA